MRAKTVGALVGFGAGWAILHFGFVTAVFLGACALVGWLIGKIADGEISLLELAERYSRRDRV
jgi:hypothetical protein